MQNINHAEMRTKSNIEATKVLTTRLLGVNVLIVPMVRDVFQSMILRLKYEAERVQEFRNDMEKLASSYHRYCDLQKNLKASEDRIKRIVAVLGANLISQVKESEDGNALREILETDPTPTKLRTNAPLWKMLAEYLSHVPEATVEEIAVFMEAVGVNDLSRQAIESALRTHAKTFRITKRGREKYISLRRTA